MNNNIPPFYTKIEEEIQVKEEEKNTLDFNHSFSTERFPSYNSWETIEPFDYLSEIKYKLDEKDKLSTDQAFNAIAKEYNCNLEDLYEKIINSLKNNYANIKVFYKGKGIQQCAHHFSRELYKKIQNDEELYLNLIKHGLVRNLYFDNILEELRDSLKSGESYQNFFKKHHSTDDVIFPLIVKKLEKAPEKIDYFYIAQTLQKGIRHFPKKLYEMIQKSRKYEQFVLNGLPEGLFSNGEKILGSNQISLKNLAKDFKNKKDLGYMDLAENYAMTLPTLYARIVALLEANQEHIHLFYNAKGAPLKDIKAFPRALVKLIMKSKRLEGIHKFFTEEKKISADNNIYLQGNQNDFESTYQNINFSPKNKLAINELLLPKINEPSIPIKIPPFMSLTIPPFIPLKKTNSLNETNESHFVDEERFPQKKLKFFSKDENDTHQAKEKNPVSNYLASNLDF